MARVKRRAAVSIAILATVATISILSDPPGPQDHFVYLPFVANNWNGNFLRNPSFEQGLGGGCKWLNYPDGVWSSVCYDEQDPPKDWTAGWIHQEPCYNDYVTGLPEMKLAERWVDPIRVFEGDYAAQAYTFWRCGFWWWQQTVDLPPGQYQGSAYVQTWDDGT